MTLYELTGELIELMDKALNELDPKQFPDSCDGCKYDDAGDGVLVPCGYCKRNEDDYYEGKG